ncbi:tyrosine-type recombinase/integrase [Natrinema salaciae]|uniref:Phage integrase family protein n=1 Tax=Natrinema salaciae TaxID=1186196 RepID=A0A1H9CHA0_9EURY|nr:site-specific integrase [Natrinema salaciae]SEQ00586.1 Phage integrase family protein [Natrinema salaciae]
MNPPQTAGPGDVPDLELEEAMQLFISRNQPNWKGETARTYRKSLDTFEAFAEETDLETLDDLEMWRVGRFTDYLLSQDYARVTVQSKQKQARRWLKWLESQGYIEVGTHLAIEPLKLTDSEQTSSDIFRPETLNETLAYYRDSLKWRSKRGHALLEIIGHTGARRSCIRALDVDDYDPEARTLTFLNRPKTGTRLKRGDAHQRKVVLAETPNRILEEYVERDRSERHDEHGRRPLFASARGRPVKSTITNWIYQATLPCVRKSCPHGKERHKCQWTEQQDSSKCPSSTSPHPVRRGSITWQLNIGRSVQDVADRAATTPDVIRRYYDRPDLDSELRRRITDFDGIDLCKHSDPSDINEEIDQ